MLELLVMTLLLFWVLGFVTIQGIVFPNILLFSLNGQPITLWHILALFTISWIIGILPSPIREILSVFLVVWVLSVFGVITLIVGLPNILLMTIVLGLVLYALTGKART